MWDSTWDHDKTPLCDKNPKRIGIKFNVQSLDVCGYKESTHSTYTLIKFNALMHDIMETKRCTETEWFSDTCY